MCSLHAVAPATLLLASVATGLLALALNWDDWGEVAARPPQARHEVVGHFGPWHVCVYVHFLPDPALPWKEVVPPLRIPWIPLRYFVQGPPSLRLFHRRTSAARSLGPAPGAEDTEIVMVNSYGRGLEEEEEWDSALYRPLLVAAEFAQRCGWIALALLFHGFAAEALALIMLWRKRHGARGAAGRLRHMRVLRLAAVLYMLSAVPVLAGAVCFSAIFRHRFHLLVSDFLYGLTDGDAAVWPPDLVVRFMNGAWAYLGSGLLALLAGFVLVGCELDGILVVGREASPAAVPDVLVVPMTRPGCPPLSPDAPASSDVAGSSSATAAGGSAAAASSSSAQRLSTAVHRSQQNALISQALRSTRAQILAHNRWVMKVVFAFMFLFILLLGLTGFFLTRRAVEGAVQNALRGPQLSVKQKTGAIWNAPRDAGQSVKQLAESLHNNTHDRLQEAAQNSREACASAVVHVKGAVVTSAVSARSVMLHGVDLVRRQDWAALWRLTAQVASDVAAGAMRGCADAASALWDTCRQAGQWLLERVQRPRAPPPPVPAPALAPSPPPTRRWLWWRRRPVTRAALMEQEEEEEEEEEEEGREEERRRALPRRWPWQQRTPP